MQNLTCPGLVQSRDLRVGHRSACACVQYGRSTARVQGARLQLASRPDPAPRGSGSNGGTARSRIRNCRICQHRWECPPRPAQTCTQPTSLGLEQHPTSARAFPTQGLPNEALLTLLLTLRFCRRRRAQVGLPVLVSGSTVLTVNLGTVAWRRESRKLRSATASTDDSHARTLVRAYARKVHGR